MSGKAFFARRGVAAIVKIIPLNVKSSKIRLFRIASTRHSFIKNTWKKSPFEERLKRLFRVAFNF